MYPGKHVGMLDSEWSQIVQSQLNEHNAEKDARKQKLSLQREQMRQELHEQVAFKSDLKRQSKEKELKRYQD